MQYRIKAVIQILPGDWYSASRRQEPGSFKQSWNVL